MFVKFDEIMLKVCQCVISSYQMFERDVTYDFIDVRIQLLENNFQRLLLINFYQDDNRYHSLYICFLSRVVH